MTSGIRYWLRATLPGPPGQASLTEGARALYRAAIQQFEELLDAAGATGYAARPLPLFYALAQAGRAIVAVRGNAPATSHGLSLEVPTASGSDPLDALVRPDRGNGWFQAVARAVESPIITHPVALGAMLASLPELSQILMRDPKWPSTLYAELFGSIRPRTSPPDNSRWFRIAIAIRRDLVLGLADLNHLLASFPTVATSYRPTSSFVGSGGNLEWTRTIGGDAVVIDVRANDPAEPAEALLQRIAPAYRWANRHWIRPGFSDGEPPPSPLMTWWMLLFSLSMLARYYPVAWFQALDRRQSPIATELERTMDVALEAIPHLVLEAVGERPILIPPRSDTPPMDF